MNELAGKIILVTRAIHQADELVQLVEQCGGTAVVFPTIEITPPESWEACDRAIDSLYMYDGLIFTSTNGVECFFQRLSAWNLTAHDLQSKMVCVVGEKTKQAVKQHGVVATAVPEKFTASDLARTLRHDDLIGKSFLFPRGNLSRDVLPEALKVLGASVESVIVYQTKAPRPEQVESVKQMLMGGKIDVATFTSPSTFRNFAVLFTRDELKRIQQRTKIAVIGPVTAKALEDAGLDVDIVPKESTMESLVEAISESLR